MVLYTVHYRGRNRYVTTEELMRIENFSRLFQRHGGYSLPVLIELKYPDKTSWYFTNNRQDVQWNGKLYVAVPMSYKPPSSQAGIPSGGTLEISLDEQMEMESGGVKYGEELLKWFDEADDKAEIEVIAIINEQGDIIQVGLFLHRFGTVTWDGRKITWNVGEDDRFHMQINPWNLDADALIG